jgi:phosphoglycerate dehydrogenase-like enzyme
MPKYLRSRTIAILDIIPDKRAHEMRALLPNGFALLHNSDGPREKSGDTQMIELLQEADFAISGQVAVSAAVLRGSPHLKLLHKWGVGVDNIDVETARELGIRIARTTGSNAQAVAEFTINLMLSALRCSAYGHHLLKQGIWHGPAKLPVPTLLLTGKTVGIVGLGAIGQSVARLLKGFDCTILYTKRIPLSKQKRDALGVRQVTLDRLLAEADVVSLHCPLTSETADMIDRAAFARMKNSAILVNVARGGVVVESDLFDALQNRTIQAAAMDVFSVEPLPTDSPLLTLDNLVITPHLAAVTADTFEPTVRRMFENIRRIAMGEMLPERDVVI